MIGQLLLAHVAALSWTGEASAQSRDPEITRGAADSEISVEANGATLGQILDRLFTERGIEIDWRDQALAGKAIEGSFRGPLDQVTQRLLAGLSYFAVSARSDGETRITRVVILGGTLPVETAARTPVAVPARANPLAPPKLRVNAARFRPKIYK